MSLVSIKPFFRARMSALKYKEWVDPFADDNIPANLIDGAYHLRVLGTSGRKTSQSDIEFNHQVQVKLFFKGFRDVDAAETKARQKADEIVSDICLPSNQPKPIVGAYLSSFACEPYDNAENDNVVVAVFIFDVRTFLCLI